MPWRLLDTGKVGDLPLDLHEREGEHMVRVGGLELMSSLCHASEVPLTRPGLRHHLYCCARTG